MPISGAVPFSPAHVEGGGSPNTRFYNVKSGETFVFGAPLTINAGEVDEIDTDDVTLIVGTAGAPNQSAYGYGMADQPTVVTGRVDRVPVYIANRDVVFKGALSNGTTGLVTPADANVGVKYGIVKQADGRWTVDSSDTTNLVVTVIGYSLAQGGSPDIVFFKFIGSTLYTT